MDHYLQNLFKDKLKMFLWDKCMLGLLPREPLTLYRYCTITL